MHIKDKHASLVSNPERGINLAQSNIRDKFFVPFGFYIIMAAQFFSALADNALLIAAIAALREMHVRVAGEPRARPRVWAGPRARRPGHPR